MQNSMVVFTFCFIDHKCFFWANSVQKIKIASLSQNLVTRLIRIYRIPKNQKCHFKLKFGSKTNI